jgi:hypothetical protein
VLRNAWARLVHKQFLFVYPLVIGVVDAVAFFAVYAALGGPLSWGEFARADFAAGTYLHAHLSQLARPGLPLLVAVAAGVCVCFVSAAVRAPFYRAIAGPSYPTAPRSWHELSRLFVFYLILYPVVRIVPDFFEAGASITVVGGLALLVVSVLVIYIDYAIVLEDLPVLTAVSRNLRLLRRGWASTIFVFLAFALLYNLVWGFYQSHFDSNFRLLFPISWFLVDTLFALVGDVIFIFLYDHLRRS